MRLRERVQQIIDGDYKPPVAVRYRVDGKPSKHDQCPHGQFRYQGCEECVCIALKAALEECPD